jgi:hypothetical protein
MEQPAAHAYAVAAVAEHLAWRERTQADEAQRVLSQCKVFLALLPDEAALQLIAPKLDADDPAARLGAAAVYSTAAQTCARFARSCCASRSRGHSPCPDRTTSVPASSVTAAPMAIPKLNSAHHRLRLGALVEGALTDSPVDAAAISPASSSVGGRANTADRSGGTLRRPDYAALRLNAFGSMAG